MTARKCQLRTNSYLAPWRTWSSFLSAITRAKSNGRALQRNTKRSAKPAAANRQEFCFGKPDSILTSEKTGTSFNFQYRDSDALQRFRAHPAHARLTEIMR